MQKIGVLVFSRRPGSKQYASADVALAEELAGRAAAVDNARASPAPARSRMRCSGPCSRLASPPSPASNSRRGPAGQPAVEVGGDFYDGFTLGDTGGVC